MIRVRYAAMCVHELTGAVLRDMGIRRNQQLRNSPTHTHRYAGEVGRLSTKAENVAVVPKELLERTSGPLNWTAEKLGGRVPVRAFDCRLLWWVM